MCSECGRIVDVQSGKFPREEEPEELDLGDFSIKESKYFDSESDNEKTAPIPPIPVEGSVPREDRPAPPPPEEVPEYVDELPEEEINEDEEGTAEALIGGLSGWKEGHKKAIIIAKLALALIVMILIVAFLLTHLISIGYDSDQLIGQNKIAVSEMLERQGFSRVRTLPLEDLELNEAADENKVTRIEIGDTDEFKAKKHFLKWQKIKVYYKTLKRVPLPVSSKECKDMNYQELMSMFEEAGFVNITAIPGKELTFTLLHSENEVEKVFVEKTEDKFSKGDKYRPDTEIIIQYYQKK